MRVQRMGAKWRIVYDESRGLAKFNSGQPVDDGGFMDVWDGTTKKTDGQIQAMQKLSEVMAGQQASDPEEENIGP
jgi:hypothetical protein